MKKYIYIILIIVFFNILLLVEPTKSFFQDLFLNIKGIGTSVVYSFDNLKDNLNTKQNLQKENQQLQKEVELLQQENDELTKENEIVNMKNNELSSTLEVRKHTEKEYLLANVEFKKLNTPLNIVTIDKGSKDDVKKNQLVSYNAKVIGYIYEVREDQSDVMLLNNENMKFNIPINIVYNDQKVTGVISEYDAKDNSLIIKTNKIHEEIKKGAKVYTNGYGQNQRSNEYVGQISGVKEVNNIENNYYIDFDLQTFDYLEVCI